MRQLAPSSREGALSNNKVHNKDSEKVNNLPNKDSRRQIDQNRIGDNYGIMKGGGGWAARFSINQSNELFS